MLHGATRLQLVTIGRVVRCSKHTFAVASERHEFRTMKRRPESVAGCSNARQGCAQELPWVRCEAVITQDSDNQDRAGGIETLHSNETTEKRDRNSIQEPVLFPRGHIPLSDGKPGRAGQVGSGAVSRE